MEKQTPLSIRDILATLSPSQGWTIGGAVVAVVVGSFGLGVYVQGVRADRTLLGVDSQHERAVRAKDQEIADLKAKIRRSNDKVAALSQTHDSKVKQLEEKNADLQRASLQSQAGLEALATQHAGLETKTEFLNRYVSYLLGPDSVAKKLFADYVCVMWKKTQERRLTFDRGRLDITARRLTRNISLDTVRLLRRHGITEVTIQRMQHLSRVAKSPRVGRIPIDNPRALRARRELDELTGRVNARLDKFQITKSVTFGDGTRYTIPQPVAIEVHTREDCAPR